MRNNVFLDNKRPEDDKISELFYHEGKPYRTINGKMIEQLEQIKENEDLNKIINRVRASGMTPWEYLNNN
jgi:hypothetical protein